MTDQKIPIPPAQQWREFRIRAVPALMFILVSFVVYYLWDQRVASANMTGMVVGVQAELRSSQAGYLTPLQATRFQHVSAGDVIAQVVTTDPRVLEARLSVVLAEVEMIRFGMGPLDNRQRNRLSQESMQMELMQQRIELASANIHRQRLEQEFRRVSSLRESGLVSEDEYERVGAELEALTLEVEERSELLDVMQARVEALSLENGGGADGDAVAAAIRLQEERLRLIEAELMPVTLVAPIDGMVSRIFRSGGEQVAGGEPVLTIQSANPDYIVAYLPHPLRIEPEVGMPVVVRSRSSDTQEFEAQIVNVGVQVEEMSEVESLQPQPGMLRTGLSLKISLTDDVTLRPGELVDLTLRPR